MPLNPAFVAVSLIAALVGVAPTGKASEAVAECGGTIVIDCTHKHGVTNHFCTVYMEGSNSHWSETLTPCLHEIVAPR